MLTQHFSLFFLGARAIFIIFILCVRCCEIDKLLSTSSPYFYFTAAETTIHHLYSQIDCLYDASRITTCSTYSVNNVFRVMNSRQ